jgi:hypothetical protein
VRRFLVVLADEAGQVESCEAHGLTPGVVERRVSLMYGLHRPGSWSVVSVDVIAADAGEAEIEAHVAAVVAAFNAAVAS